MSCPICQKRKAKRYCPAKEGTLCSVCCGTLVTVARVSPIPLLRAAAFAYVQFFLNVPLLALLIITVFALPDAGVIGPLLPTAIITLAVYEAAYVAEAVRSGRLDGPAQVVVIGRAGNVSGHEGASRQRVPVISRLGCGARGIVQLTSGQARARRPVRFTLC